MIKTKLPQEYDAQNKKTGIIFFRILTETQDHTNATRKIQFNTFLETSPKVYTQIGPDYIAVFKEVTYLGLFGDKTVQQMETEKDQLFINNLAYLNTITWTGSEAQKDQYRFWDLTAEDFEIA